MTNNEAAKWIQLYIDLARLDPLTGEAAYLNNDDRKMIEAMEMAINALTAQPETHDKRTETHACDCISRQAAIDACHDYEDGEGAYAYGFIVEERLRNLPSAQPEPDWDYSEETKQITLTVPEDVYKSAKTIFLSVGYEGTFGIRGMVCSAQPEQCSDCIVHGGDWECDHIHCRKGRLSDYTAIKCEIQKNIDDFYNSEHHAQHVLSNGRMIAFGLELALDIVKDAERRTDERTD